MNDMNDMNGEEYGCKFSLLLPLCPSLNAHYHVNATDLRRPLKCFHGSRILTTCNARTEADTVSTLNS